MYPKSYKFCFCMENQMEVELDLIRVGRVISYWTWRQHEQAKRSVKGARNEEKRTNNHLNWSENWVKTVDRGLE